MAYYTNCCYLDYICCINKGDKDIMGIIDFQQNFKSVSDFIEKTEGNLFRMWYKDSKEDGFGANYVYLVGSIPLHNDTMILIQHYDETRPNFRYPSISFVKFSEIILGYYDDDQEFGEDKDE